MIIGTFTEENGAYNGRINAFALNVDTFRILPAKTKQGSGPDFIAYCFTMRAPVDRDHRFRWKMITQSGDRDRPGAMAQRSASLTVLNRR